MPLDGLLLSFLCTEQLLWRSPDSSVCRIRADARRACPECPSLPAPFIQRESFLSCDAGWLEMSLQLSCALGPQRSNPLLAGTPGLVCGQVGTPVDPTDIPVRPTAPTLPFLPNGTLGPSVQSSACLLWWFQSHHGGPRRQLTIHHTHPGFRRMPACPPGHPKTESTSPHPDPGGTQ